MRHEVRKYSGWDVNTMVAISMAESGCNPAKNNLTATETHKDLYGRVVCVGSYGAMQIGCVHNVADPAALNNLSFNIQKAHAVWQGQGYRAWSVYTNGKYRQYL